VDAQKTRYLSWKNSVHLPAVGKSDHLRVLLNSAKGHNNYDDFRTVNDIVYPTFKEGCYALDLLNDDKEWNNALLETVNGQ